MMVTQVTWIETEQNTNTYLQTKEMKHASHKSIVDYTCTLKEIKAVIVVH